jgi:hypothetical protein
MRTAWAFVGAMALVGSTFVTVAHTQSGTPQTPVAPAPGAQTTIGEPRSSAGYNATFTGCIERADQLATANPAAQSTDKDSQMFVLTNVSKGAGSTPVGTSGTAANPVNYQLDAEPAKLNPHVGHQVEVSGVVSVVAGGAAATTGSTTVAALDSNPHLKVENIKMIAETCKK